MNDDNKGIKISIGTDTNKYDEDGNKVLNATEKYNLMQELLKEESPELAKKVEKVAIGASTAINIFKLVFLIIVFIVGNLLIVLFNFDTIYQILHKDELVYGEVTKIDSDNKK